MNRLLSRLRLLKFKGYVNQKDDGNVDDDDGDGVDMNQILAILLHKAWTWRLFACCFAALIGTSFMTGFTLQAFISLSAISPYSNGKSSNDQNNELDNFTALSDREIGANRNNKHRRSDVFFVHFHGLAMLVFWLAKLIYLMGPAALLTNKFGRRRSLIIGASVGLLAFVLALVPIYLEFIAGTIVWAIACGLMGLQSGNSLVVAPSYLAEIAPNSARGSCGVLYEIFYWAGVALAFIVEADFFFNGNAVFAVLTGISLSLFVVHLLMLIFFAEESPRWLLQVGQKEAAVDVVKRLRKCPVDEAVAEVEEMKPPSSSDNNNQPKSSNCCFSCCRLVWPMFLGSSLMAANEFTGASLVYKFQTAVLQNGTEGYFTRRSDYDWDFPVILAVVLVLLYLGVMALCAILVDRIGRRRLVLAGLAGMALAYLPVALGVILEHTTAWHIGSVFFMAAYSIGPGPIASFMVAEMFDQRFRLCCMSVCRFLTQLFPFALLELRDIVNDDAFKYFFLPLGVFFCALELILMFLFLPETKRISLEKAAAKFQPGKRRLQLGFTETSSASNDNIKIDNGDILLDAVNVYYSPSEAA